MPAFSLAIQPYYILQKSIASPSMSLHNVLLPV